MAATRIPRPAVSLPRFPLERDHTRYTPHSIGVSMALDLTHTIRSIVRPSYAGSSPVIVSTVHVSTPKIARGR